MRYYIIWLLTQLNNFVLIKIKYILVAFYMRLCLYMSRVCTMLVLTCCFCWFVSYNNTQDDCCSRPCNVKVLIIYIYVVVSCVFIFGSHPCSTLWRKGSLDTHTHRFDICERTRTNKQTMKLEQTTKNKNIPNSILTNMLVHIITIYNIKVRDYHTFCLYSTCLYIFHKNTHFSVRNQAKSNIKWYEAFFLLMLFFILCKSLNIFIIYTDFRMCHVFVPTFWLSAICSSNYVSYVNMGRCYSFDFMHTMYTSTQKIILDIVYKYNN